tara:strand:+ start:1728 stop:2633 length:906 start_codon:yes stop_codon:yes gene_type:complete
MVEGAEMAGNGQQVYLAGRLIPLHDAAISVQDRGYTLGDGLFETLAIRQGQALHLTAHLDRLANGAAQLALPLPASATQMARQLTDLIAVNQIREGSARLTVSRGTGDRGLALPDHPRPSLLITTSASRATPGPRYKTAVLSQRTRRNDLSPLSRLKTTGGYLDHILALREAEDRGADDALLLNTAGRVACGSVGNLFLVRRDGGLVTPPISDGVLAGIARQLIITGLGAAQASLLPADLHQAQGLLLSNSLGVTIITDLEDHCFQTRQTANPQVLDLADKMLAIILQDKAPKVGSGVDRE